MADHGSFRRLQATDPSCKDCPITKQALCNKCQDDTPAFTAAVNALMQSGTVGVNKTPNLIHKPGCR